MFAAAGLMLSDVQIPVHWKRLSIKESRQEFHVTVPNVNCKILF